MKIRGVYSINQTDRILTDDKLREKAQKAIIEDLTNSFSQNFGDQIIREEGSVKYPYGRFYLDIDVNPVK